MQRLIMLAAMAVNLAAAASITYQVNIPEPPAAPNPLDPSKTLGITDRDGVTVAESFPQFDPNLGTLNSAAYTITYNYYFDHDITNSTATGVDFNAGGAFLFLIEDTPSTATAYSNSWQSLPMNGYFLLPFHAIELTGTISLAGQVAPIDNSIVSEDY